jgi:hypothetical protein
MSIDRHNPQDRLYRFKGVSAEGNTFYVQIKEDVRRKQKFFMSVFPA